MSDLQNQTPADTYKGLLQVGDYTNGVDGNSEYVQDGEGTNSALSISTTKVGVGTVSPSAELDVNGNVVADEYALDGTGASTSAVAIHAPTTNELAIRTNSTERIRIDSSGNVGINNTSPLSDFVVTGGTDNTASSLEVNCANNDVRIDALQRDNSNTPSPIKYVAESHVFLGSTGGSGGDGNVGVHTTSPLYELDVHGVISAQANALSTDAEINLTGSNSSIYGAISRIKSTSESNANAASSLTFSTRLSDNTINERMRIDSSGNVGINTVSPAAPLDVSSTTGGVIIPRMTTTQRDAISSPTDGEMIYNTTTNKFQGRANGAWVDFH